MSYSMCYPIPRKENNELADKPGFFFYPRDEKDLIELSLKERASLMDQDGHYGVMLTDFNHQGQVCDLVCLLDNSNYPTHRHKDTPLSSYSGRSSMLVINDEHKGGFKPGEIIMFAAKR